MTDWKATIADPEHPIWTWAPKVGRTCGLVVTLGVFQSMTATSWDLDGEGVTLLAVTVGKVLEEMLRR